MRNYRNSMITALLLSLSVSMVTPVYAFSVADVVSQTSNKETSSSKSGILDILLGLLMGKLVGNVMNVNSNANTAAISPIKQLVNVLGMNETPLSQSTTSGNKIVDTAKKYMGVPYVWGGVTPAGWDCSGYTQYVMNLNGIQIPRTAAEQFSTGTSINKSDLQAGDLVFFTTYKPGASHVGFYMGDGKFIHASSVAEKVTISELGDSYYTEHYIGARRYNK